MKQVSQALETKESDSEKKPSELYHIWRGSTHWRYTSLDDHVVFNGNNYSPVAVKRDSVTYDYNLDVSSLNITFAYITDPVIKFISRNPVEVIWVEIFRILRDMDPVEATVVFVGQIKNVSFQGVQANVSCVGFEHYLKQPIPTERYQPQCNYTVFGTKCALSDSSYKLSSISATIDSTGLIITATEFGSQADGYYQWGRIEWSDYKRMIVKHEGNDVTLRYPLLDFPSTGGLIDAWPGCDWTIETCRDKYDNVVNFGGFPYIPIDNPATWT